MPRAVDPRVVPPDPDPDLDHPSLYLNRELSWLDFNWRVLHQAVDPRNPLLERVRFLGITQSNLDEFFRKRVGGLKRQHEAGVSQLTIDGRSPAEQLAAIRPVVLEMQEQMGKVWKEQLLPQLEQAGIVIRAIDDLEGPIQEELHRYFMDQVYPILTPLAVDPGHPFPFISNQSLSLAILLRYPEGEGHHFARVKIPLERGRWIPLEEPGHYVRLDDLVNRHVGELFRGTELDNCHVFRVTRNADVRRYEEEAEDLLEMISGELRERRFASVVRLEVERSMPGKVIRLLTDELKLEETDVYKISGLLDFTDATKLADLDYPHLKYPRWEPVIPDRLHAAAVEDQERSIFQILKSGDILVHHPYDSFSGSVQRFVEEAAADPDVVAIKSTLYRTSADSPIVHALIRAAEKGKQVACLVEVTARFDEQQNIEWGLLMERAGVHVTYGLVGLKTHAKVTLVVRDEKKGLRTYSHIGTGNYHGTTANIYTDLGLLTATKKVGYDLVNLFHYLTGHAPEQEYKSLIIAPRDMRGAMEEMVDREVQHQQAGRVGRIILKMNAIDDSRMIRSLYRASQEGVRIDLIVRGHCRLRPGIPGVSETIRVISIIGRFLEHDRIFYFGNDGDSEILIGSADWRRRNLVDRVEAMVRITEPELKARLVGTLEHALEDNRLAWDMDGEGYFKLRMPRRGAEVRNYHRTLMREAEARRRP
jgi:polyphosphate kinase